jgi:hypothetical protein
MSWPATTIVHTVLRAKSIANREHARNITKGTHRPHSAETRAKLSDALRRRMSLSDKEMREYLAAKRSKWLTDCIVARADRKVFDVTVRADAGGFTNVHVEMPLDASLLDFLLLIMRCEAAPLVMRIDCAKNAAMLMYERKGKVVVEDHR